MPETRVDWNYLRKKKKQVGGWLQRVDAEIIGAILEYQEREMVIGGAVEIGVHHGKSFIPIASALRDDERALCIDIFGAQELNLDSSGRGDLEVFRANLARFGIDESRVRVLQQSSESVTADDIRQAVGTVRYFSVDGGHWKSIVENDLELAENTVGNDGVIALDDYCRAEWPDVSAGYISWQQDTTSRFVPFAIGSNKLYLCHEDRVAAYREALRTEFLSHYWTKSYATFAGEVDCYRLEPWEQDEAGPLSTLRSILGWYRPGLFAKLTTSKQKVR